MLPNKSDCAVCTLFGSFWGGRGPRLPHVLLIRFARHRFVAPYRDKPASDLTWMTLSSVCIPRQNPHRSVAMAFLGPKVASAEDEEAAAGIVTCPSLGWSLAQVKSLV